MATQYKDILVHLDEADASAARLDLAVALAAHFDAHLCGLCVKQDPELAILKGMPTPSFLKDELLARENARLHALREHFEATTHKAAVSSEWRAADGALVQALSRQAHYCDLLVVGQNRDHDPVNIIASPVSSVALAAGVPVLAVPPAGGNLPVGGRVIVAWDGGREAIRAVHDGLPLLSTATIVEVVTVSSSRSPLSTHVPGADIALHLARLGVNAEAVPLATNGTDVARTLLGHATQTGANAVVMGAFGHSRVRELVLGGVTREVMHNMTIPVLLSH